MHIFLICMLCLSATVAVALAASNKEDAQLGTFLSFFEEKRKSDAELTHALKSYCPPHFPLLASIR